MNCNNVLIIDNGAFWSKIGTTSEKQPRCIPNCIMKAKSERRRPFIGDQIEECRDASGLFFILPFQKGYLINWDVQKTVWDYLFSKEGCNYTLSECDVIVTEPHFNFPPIQELMTEIFFEEYECPALLRTNASSLSNFKYMKDNTNSLCCVVVDCGYSFTHVIPYIKGKKVKEAVKRIDVGGKLLTNHLKDLMSYRQLNVMDETYAMNQAKEDCCYVPLDFNRDMEIARKRGKENTIFRDYVLPDFTTIRRGYVKESDQNVDGQFLRINTERFSVPELIFTPLDVGIDQMGLAHLISHCISLCPEETWPHLFSNIILTGGSTKFPGFHQRLQKEVRSLAPDVFDVKVVMPENPVTYAWEGGLTVSKDSSYYDKCVSKADYEEQGYLIIDEKFDI